MSLDSIVKTLSGLDGKLSIGGVILVVLLSLIQISKINWNPWDMILGWIGSKLNSGLKKEVSEIKMVLDKHIEESEKEKLENTRRDILDFCNACMNGRKHTQEQFRFVIKQCDQYEKYIETNNIKNGEISSAIEEIRRLYSLCIQKNSFLKGEDEK